MVYHHQFHVAEDHPAGDQPSPCVRHPKIDVPRPRIELQGPMDSPCVNWTGRDLAHFEVGTLTGLLVLITDKWP